MGAARTTFVWMGSASAAAGLVAAFALLADGAGSRRPIVAAEIAAPVTVSAVDLPPPEPASPLDLEAFDVAGQAGPEPAGAPAKRVPTELLAMFAPSPLAPAQLPLRPTLDAPLERGFARLSSTAPAEPERTREIAVEVPPQRPTFTVVSLRPPARPAFIELSPPIGAPPSAAAAEPPVAEIGAPEPAPAWSAATDYAAANPTVPWIQEPPRTGGPGFVEERGFQSGIASWYGPGFHGRKTASGERFDQNAMTAAHKTLPFGTRVRVVDQTTGRSVVVRINDRGPFKPGRVIDLSKASAQALGAGGLSRVRLVSASAD